MRFSISRTTRVNTHRLPLVRLTTVSHQFFRHRWTMSRIAGRTPVAPAAPTRRRFFCPEHAFERRRGIVSLGQRLRFRFFQNVRRVTHSYSASQNYLLYDCLRARVLSEGSVVFPTRAVAALGRPENAQTNVLLVFTGGPHQETGGEPPRSMVPGTSLRRPTVVENEVLVRLSFDFDAEWRQRRADSQILDSKPRACHRRIRVRPFVITSLSLNERFDHSGWDHPVGNEKCRPLKLVFHRRWTSW